MTELPPLVRALLQGRDDAACWQPAPGGFLGPTVPERTTVLQAEWLIDDGNLVIAVVSLDDVAGRVEDAARQVDKTGRLIDSAILDAGLHRLLVLVVCTPQGFDASGLEGGLESRGQFRVLVFSGDPKDEVAARSLAVRLAPLRLESFLKEIPEEEDADVAAAWVEALNVRDGLEPLRAAIASAVGRWARGPDPIDGLWDGCVQVMRAFLPDDSSRPENDDG